MMDYVRYRYNSKTIHTSETITNQNGNTELNSIRDSL